MSVTRDQIEKGLCFAWAVFLFTLVAGHREFEGLYNSVIIGTAVIAPFLRGWRWIIETYRFRWILVGTGVYLLCISVSALVAEPYPEGLDLIREYPGKGLLILFNLLFLFRRKENWIWFMWGIAGAIGVSLFLAYYNLLTPDAMNLTENPTGEQFSGSISILGYHKNIFGSFLTYLVPLLSGFVLLLFYQHGTESLSGWVFLTVTVVAVPMLFFTKSRSAQAAVFVGMAIPPVMLALKSGYWKTLAAGGVTCLLLLITTLFVTEIGQSLIDRWSQGNVVTLGGRTTNVWPKFYAIAKERPYFGHGLKELNRQSVKWYSHEHSTYLAHLLRTGWVGLVGFCIFLLLTFLTIVRKLYRDPITPEHLIFLAFVGSFVSGVILEGIVEPVRWPKVYMISIAGLIVAACLDVRETSSESAEDVCDERAV